MNDGRWDDVYAEQRKYVEKFGQGIIGVFAAEDDPNKDGFVPFMYTVGRSERGKPDLVIYGPLRPEHAGTILNMVDEFDKHTPVKAGDRLGGLIGTADGTPYDLTLIDVDPEECEMNVALAMYDDVTAMQVVWPDDDNKFPWEGWKIPDEEQPLHGEIPDVHA